MEDPVNDIPTRCPNLAARRQAGTAPDTIAIDPTTRRLLGSLFEYRDLGDIEAKGFANRLQAYEVANPASANRASLRRSWNG